ncbi:hypothetical protein [Limnohabitans planktonicus]|nr:hypothetical protein [Limnohabitans planktonicus]
MAFKFEGEYTADRGLPDGMWANRAKIRADVKMPLFDALHGKTIMRLS